MVEQRDELRNLCREFFAATGSDRVRAAMDSESGVDADSWLRACQELGLVGVGIQSEYGGAGGTIGELAVVLEEAGTALYPGPLLASAGLASMSLTVGGSAAARSRWLSAIASGGVIATRAHGGSFRAQAVADGWVVSGSAALVVDGIAADLIVIAAAVGDDTALFAVDPRAAGVDRRAVDMLDLTRRYADLRLDGAECALASEGTLGAEVSARLDQLCYLAVALEQLGGAQACLDMAVRYAQTREQFGRPIGSFQAIKHALADVLTAVEYARAAVEQALALVDGDGDDLAVAASIAKAYAGDAYVHAAKQNIQVHGGMGFTWEHNAHLYLRRAKTMQQLWGSSAWHRARIAELVGL